MRRALLFTTLVLFIVLSGTMATADVNIYYGEDQGVGFLVPREGAEDLEIVPGSIFFEVGGERTVITDEPDVINLSGNKSAMMWKTDKGKVAIGFTKRGLEYDIILRGVDFDTDKWGFSIYADDTEYFTGLMERVVDGGQEKSWEPGICKGMDLKYQKVDMIVKPTTSVYAPFYVSSESYGLFANTTWPGHFDFCYSERDSVQIWFEGPRVDITLYTYADPAKSIKAHSMQVGPPLLIPKWGFGVWRWRDDHAIKDEYYDGTKVDAPFNSQVVEDVLMMEAFDIPCDVYWLDRPWATGWNGYDDFNWNPKRFPNHKQMIEWLNSKDMELFLWIAPWVMGDMAKVALDKGYNLPGQTRDEDELVLIDYTNPEAKRWWMDHLQKVVRDGVAGFKLDRSEERVPSDVAITVHDGRTTREIRNDYPVQYVQATYEAVEEIRGDDFVLLPRAAFTGSSKYAALWGGDVFGSEWGLRASIIALQRSAVMGYPYWGSDTCGYASWMEPEVCARWLAFSAFCPIMEVGPTVNRAFWDMPNEPSYNTELIAAYRTWSKVHTDLKDYTYKYAVEASETGMPIARPLFMMDPADENSYKYWDTYYYGEDIIVSPIWKKGTWKKEVYLPANARWTDAWTGKEYSGGRAVTVIAREHWKIPIFVRSGSDVDLGDLKALYEESLELAEKKPDLAELQKSIGK